MISLEGEKVISAKAMSEMEQRSIREGASDLEYMQKAGEGIALAAAEFAEEYDLPKQIFLLIGKGNNGGDAFVAGIDLLQKGFEVRAFCLFVPEECSTLCKEHRGDFEGKGGKITEVKSVENLFFSHGIILDGLLGTGFAGVIEGLMKDVIEKANASNVPILAIDIPSGLNGNTGKVETVAIQATITVYLGQPKKGFFINDGFDYVGALKREDFGLAQSYQDAFHPEAFLINEEAIPSFLPRIKRTRHKYQVGYVLGMGGSPGMAGAAIMSSWAALKAGAGIIRLFHQKEMELTNAPLEIVKEAIDLENLDPILKESKRAKSGFIGPGLGRSDKAKHFVKEVLSKVEIPLVCDADALFALSELSHFDAKGPLILTPHKKEMLRLLKKTTDFEDDADLIKACEQYVNTHDLVLLLKGAPTYIFRPKSTPLIITQGDPGMATAGTGDVLTGIIAGLLAQGLAPFEAATLGAYFHGLSGEFAAFEEGSYSLMATDLIHYLGDAITIQPSG